ncbi:MAG: cytochrome-c oxidase, cbb3-type subunit I [Bacteroidia bacterium]|nr:cytochrome-c oxidase, cbb3-type subunit I [Bacteroidia bacterium]
MTQNPTVTKARTQGATVLETFAYDNQIVRMFLMATVFWGLAGFLVGLIAAFQLVAPEFFLWDAIPYLTFSRIRPLHTNAAIFAFVGNGIYMGVYYSLQRLLKTRMFSDLLGRIHFWGWQLIILAALITLPLGITSSREYAELEWPIDIAIALVWVIFGINMIGTIIKRRERHMYVAIWFYLATWVTVAVLHIVNNIELPISMWKSYSVYAGVQDALVQWWYGHNAVAFFLTTPYLGLMYYFIPKAANRPVYSYRLSIIHFWALIFIYIWAGPHHLLYTALPDWAQSLGTVFSIMLIAPSWGGMLNGLLTLRGAWDRVQTNPVLKFMVVAVTAYGMATLEGPLLSIKAVNSISHFTDWTIGHVHVGTLGWNGFLTFGALYWLVPKMWNTKLFSTRLANAHFWIGTLGIIFYTLPLYWAGWTQGMMWKQFDADGFLVYPNFLETVTQIIPMYWIRAIGGLLYVIGAVIMIYNLVKTAGQGTFQKDEQAQAPALKKGRYNAPKGEYWHRWIERRPNQMLLLATGVILIGGIIELVPTFMVKSNVPTIATVEPYTPLELEGRDIYLREGCYVCHSQMIRPFRDEVERYDPDDQLYSMSGEFIYDHPFQWGSKRTGPDLAREGGKRSHTWHFTHMYDPRAIEEKSIMPSYEWLITDKLDASMIDRKIRAMQTLGVPYAEGYDQEALADLQKQATEIADEINKDLEAQGQSIRTKSDREIIALIAYLQRLGTDIKKVDKTSAQK